MLGWELPPHISGGLGVASEGIAQGLSQIGHQVDFLIPKKKKGHSSANFKITSANSLKPDLNYWKKKSQHIETIKLTEMGTRLIPYLPPEIFVVAKEKQVIIEKIEETEESQLLEKIQLTGEYEEGLSDELSKYALLASQYVKKRKFDIIHAHDWVTFKAGRMAATEANIPLYVHCHSTEYDRNGFHGQPFVIKEEKQGFEFAEKIFSVSQQLKNTIVEKYQVDPEKVIVVPNGISLQKPDNREKKSTKKKILFIGRFTNQKNPSVFIDIARDIFNTGLDCQFEMIGDGYLRSELENKVADKNLTDRFEFTGFLSQEKTLARLSKADLLIVPSSAEPFGIVILEAAIHKIPVIAAKGSGVAEFIPSLPEIELWDKYNFVKLASRLLTDDKYKKEVTSKAYEEAQKLTWENASKIIENTFNS